MATEEHQAQADAQDPISVPDPLDVGNSTNSGTKDALNAYAESVDSVLSQLENEDTQGEQSAPDDFLEEQDQAEDGEEDEAEDEPEVKTSKRVRLSDPIDQQVAGVAKAMGISLIEAAKIVEARTSTKHQDSSQENQIPSESVESVKAEIRELMAQKKEMLASLDFETAADLDEQIESLREKRDELKVTEAREQSRQEQSDATKFYADYAKSEQKTVGFYPDAAVENSPMAKEMVRLEAEMLELGDPLYHSTDKPFILAKEAAKNLGIPMKKPGTAPVKKTVQHRPIQPAGGNARTIPTDSAKKALEMIGSAKTMKEYEAVLRASGIS